MGGLIEVVGAEALVDLGREDFFPFVELNDDLLDAARVDPDRVERRSYPILRGLGGILQNLEAFYEDLHAHPELSMQEERTSGKAAERLRLAGFEVSRGVGKTGMVRLLKNGEGPTVMLRAG